MKLDIDALEAKAKASAFGVILKPEELLALIRIVRAANKKPTKVH